MDTFERLILETKNAIPLVAKVSETDADRLAITMGRVTPETVSVLLNAIGRVWFEISDEDKGYFISDDSDRAVESLESLMMSRHRILGADETVYLEQTAAVEAGNVGKFHWQCPKTQDELEDYLISIAPQGRVMS